MALRPLQFHGDSLTRLQAFPMQARSDAGYELFLVQGGKDPRDWKPMSTIGPGVRENRVRDETGGYRVVYVANLPDAVHVLHAFQKRTQKTEKRDLDLATARFRRLKQEQTR